MGLLRSVRRRLGLNVTFISALTAYAQLGFLLTGKSVNGFVFRMGFNTELWFPNKSIQMDILYVFFQKMVVSVTSSKMNNSASVCLWEGVFCNAKQQSVIGLVASGMGHSGVILETTVGKLNMLQTLDLSNNKITSLSSDFWSLGTSLKYHNLSCNQISGSVPSNIGNFGALERLNLSFNNLYGDIPASISSLLSLQRLY
ncbi:hypothetical protein IFM89_006486 [Coptis chinensis]|uniref:Leucine-rich repeat-containing N-terminal plant-type domain-containing protein n=1 Tax=Coptis chinensis TaxID=261450 RepID=A0A835MA10_9MAGN|nr:hypothetical protein IFM89_006486 [Coptis chinensis]